MHRECKRELHHHQNNMRVKHLQLNFVRVKCQSKTVRFIILSNTFACVHRVERDILGNYFGNKRENELHEMKENKMLSETLGDQKKEGDRKV